MVKPRVVSAAAWLKRLFILFLVYNNVAPLLASEVPMAPMPVKITPFVGQPHNWECHSVDLNQGNVIGYLSVPMDDQTVGAEILYRAGGAKGLVRMRMMREDAEALRLEIDALVRKLRSRPIQFRSRIVKEGDCEIYQVSG